MDMHLLMIGLQVVHVGMASFWLGTIVLSDVFLWPAMQAMGLKTQVQQGLLRGPLAKTMYVVATGTVLTGYLRGWAGGAFDHLYSLYGVFFVLAGLLGVFATVWWLCGRARAGPGRTVWLCSMAGMFLLMIGLRFTAP